MGIVALAGGLAAGRSLKRLILWNTGAGDAAAEALGSALATVAAGYGGGSGGCSLQVGEINGHY